MKSYDVIIIGAGDVGLGIAFKAASAGLKVVLIDQGNVGGTCVNYGCVPSKTLIYTADRIAEILEATKLDIHAQITDVDFRAVMERMRNAVTSGRSSIKKAIEETENLDFINKEGHFIDERTIEAGDEKIEGKKIFIASGSRPLIPLIKGLETISYLTNENVLELKERPKSMIIIGGGYVGLEYAHFFSALGTKVAMVHRHSSLLPTEEPEISELLKKEIGKRIQLHMNVETSTVKHTGMGYAVRIKDTNTGEEKEVLAETLLVAAGRKSNANLLRVENAGIETDKAHFVKVDEYLQTNKKHIWAVGDSNGRAMFTHAGDKEAELAWHNATNQEKVKMDFEAVPHAVFTYPQIASVGLTEERGRKSHEIFVGRAMYSDTVMGEAMVEREGFAKAIVEKGSQKILGFHIIGPHAAILIQEVVNAIINKGNVKSITECMHIFPALSGLITETLDNLE
ncbi:MAG TPA: dihydrolipoyl dehydrogenase [Thermodesulfobacteriota bacterium]|nr:dihydrolipoyl dehydrogenase [Thermodesulfobacteriota bacterium]